MIDRFVNRVPVADKGFGVPVNHYVSGRISAAVAGHGGIVAIRYNGNQHYPRNLFFESAATATFGKLARVHVLIDGAAYYLEFSETHHFPYGYRSTCCLAGVSLQHELVLDQGTLFQRLTVLKNPEGKEVRTRLMQHGHLWAKSDGRTHENWRIQSESGAMISTATDDMGNGRNAITTVRIQANQTCRTDSRHEPFKYYMETLTPCDVFIHAMVFSAGDAGDTAPEISSERIDAAIASCRQVQEGGLRFDTGNDAVDSALANAVPMVAALGIKDRPGAYRASQSYWVWGWDSMVHAEAMLWSGQPDIVRDMLDFYRETNDPEHGIAHALDGDFVYVTDVYMTTSAQMLYVVMLHNYLAATDDRETVRRHLPFAREILERASQSICERTGLGIGKGFFPDFPFLLGQDNNDLALINNSLFYQGLRAIAEVEHALGFEAEAVACAATAARVKTGLESALWDEERGYWIDSASAKDGTPRRHHPLYGQLLVSPFGTEPKADKTDRIADFLRDNFRFDYGLTMFPMWDPGFMADGNQLGAYYPPVDRYYWNVMNRCGQVDSARDFERIVAHFWKDLTYPEGLTHETVNDDPTPDEPGGKQAFSAKAWVCDALELHLGLRVTLQGISLNPLPSAKPFRVSGLSLRGKQLTIERGGDGTAARYVLNGKDLRDGQITWEMLKSKNTIEIILH